MSKSLGLFRISLFGIAGLLGCSAVLGLEEGKLDPNEGEQVCTLNSDCGAKVCIFRVCSVPCVADVDCPEASRCLRTSTGNACVKSAAATCGESCPNGTTCANGFCRSSCDPNVECLGGQSCDSGICLGSDGKHDPEGAGGRSGSAGSGGKAGGSAGKSGGAAGSAGRSGGGGAGAAGGTSGAAGSSGGGTAGIAGASGSAGKSGAGGSGGAGGATQKCGNDTREGTEACDGNDLAGLTCAKAVHINAVGPIACSNCLVDTSGCTFCGDGKKDGGEDCDGASLGGKTCASVVGAGSDGTLKCTSKCTLDATGCGPVPTCPNGAKDGTEECDGTQIFDGRSCTTKFGANATGTVKCGPNCLVDYGECTYCGDGVRNGGEACDGTDVGNPSCGPSFSGGTLACSGCALDTSGCTTCGDKVCNGGETQANCCQDCGCAAGSACNEANACAALGEWYFVTTTFANGTTTPRTVAGDASFATDGTVKLTAWKDSAGNTGGGTAFPYTLNPIDFSVGLAGDVISDGQLSAAANLLVTTGIGTATQTVWVRKGGAVSVANRRYRVIANVGNTLPAPDDKPFFGLDGTFDLDGGGCLGAARTATLSTQTPVVITFDPDGLAPSGCFDVAGDGSVLFRHKQTSSVGVASPQWRGWVGAGGDILLLTRETGAGVLGAGTIVMTRVTTTGGLDAALLKGSYGLGNLAYNASVPDLISSRGAYVLDGTGKTTGGTAKTSSGVIANVFPDSVYEVGPDGSVALQNHDDVAPSLLFQAGQAAPKTSAGTAPFFVTHSAATRNPKALPLSGSLIVWIRQRRP